MKFNIHAGHAPFNSGGASGAVGILNESIEDRKVKDALVNHLRTVGHTVYDCTCDSALDQLGVLKDIVLKCNSNAVDLDISIHLNSGREDFIGDGSTGGVEVWGYDSNTMEIATKICNSISNELGIRNRGFKTTHNLYVLNTTKSQAILIECCFVDDKDDADRWNANKCAAAIFEALTGSKLSTQETVLEQPKYWNSDLHFRVHQQGIGWAEVHQAPEIAGVIGKALRVEAIKIDYPGHDVYAKAHIQGEGWKDYGKITRDTVIGTTNQKKRLECLCLKGDFEFRVHIAKYGWLPWTRADGIVTLGTVGEALAIEAIQFRELKE